MHESFTLLCLFTSHRCRLGKYTKTNKDQSCRSIFQRINKKIHNKHLRVFLQVYSRQTSMTKDGSNQFAVSHAKEGSEKGLANEVKVDKTFGEY